MALGILFILFIAILLLSVIFSVLMIVWKNTNKGKGVFIAASIFSILIAALSASSLPSNYTTEICIALLIGFVGIIGLILNFTKLTKTYLPQVFVIVSIFGTVVKLFFI